MNRADIIRQGLELEQVGDLAGAEQVFVACINTDPNWAEAVYRKGIILLKRNKLNEAIDCFQKARSLAFRIADTWNLSGIALAWQGRHLEAANAFEQAIQHDPNFEDPYLNLSNALIELHRFAEAESRLVQLLIKNRRHVGALERLAALFAQQGQWEQAQQAYRNILDITPNHGRAHLAIGVMLANQRHFQEALTFLENACRLCPDSYEAFSNCGNCLRELGVMDEALRALNRALSINPNDTTTHQNLGILYGKLDQPRLAIEHFEASLKAMPDNADALVGIAAMHVSMGLVELAESTLKHALQMNPRHAMARFNLAQIQISNGNLEDGFRNYEWRWQTSNFTPRIFSRPTWNGSLAPEDRLLIYCEQGYGDTIQFIRYAKLAKARVAKIIVEAPKRLIPLLRSCEGVDQWIATGEELPAFDCQIAMMSLPFALRTSIDTIPCNIPYIVPDSERTQSWTGIFQFQDKLKVGLAWQGNPTHQQDALRSIRLEQLQPLIFPEIQYVSLQKLESPAESSCEASFHFLDLGREIDTDAAFIDTASIMQHLDLVISIDSAIAHLAGALGVPVYVPLIKASDWRWMRHRLDSPWYPTMKLFRQTQVADWTDVIEAIQKELRKMIQLRFG